jgi:hypothetical protein
LGLGRHQWFSRGQLMEAVISIGALIYATPRYGILGAAYVVAACMILNRGLFVPWLVSRELDLSFGAFMFSIYARPTLVGVPVAALAIWLRMTILPGVSWLQLFLASGLVAVAYFVLAFFLCLDDHHRSIFRGWVVAWLSTSPVVRESS